MANSDVPDPRRGPRRFGPSAGSPAANTPDFDDSTTVYSPPPYGGPPADRPRQQPAAPPDPRLGAQSSTPRQPAGP
ncbi:hypothetical protein ACVBEQ_18625, partial [Nakamurella sp. GG22]